MKYIGKSLDFDMNILYIINYGTKNHPIPRSGKIVNAVNR
uniref:Uncharacterized protein n=1 Tax=uncultured bacterium contig00063 TaxID=1181546 RepID=A0A806JZQ2_9BACT|nr:hypothetical protein [uncultured bacterium contig00063]